MQFVTEKLSALTGAAAHIGDVSSSTGAPYERIEMEAGGATPEQRGLLQDDDDDKGGSPSYPSSARSTPRLSQSVPPSPNPNAAPKEEISRAGFFFWIAVNCLATLGIVLVNKSILSNPTLRGAPTLFVAYHFALTGITLHIASSGAVGAFHRKLVPVVSLLPLALVFAGHTVVTNWSLALLEVAIYQELRILVTPATVMVNFLAYRKTISLQSLLALFVVCSGIGLTVYSDTLQKFAIAQAKIAAEAAAKDAASSSTSAISTAALTIRSFIAHVHQNVPRSEALHALKNSPIGYLFGMAGVFLSAIYTIWVAVYIKKLEVSSMQLLHLQAPLGCVLLLVAAVFLDSMPVWGNVTQWEWILLAASGGCAVLINVSQFFIVAGSSALSSTVVGHAKTIMIVLVGWMMATSALTFGSLMGIVVALVGIFAYSWLQLQSK